MESSVLRGIRFFSSFSKIATVTLSAIVNDSHAACEQIEQVDQIDEVVRMIERRRVLG